MARGGEQIPTPGGRRIKYFAGGIFSPGALEGSDFDVSTFFNDKKQLSVNTEHQLKSQFPWPMCLKSMKFKKNGTRAITTAKNDIFIGL